MMDSSAMYAGRTFHPMRIDTSDNLKKKVRAKFSRTERPPRYYIIDFGLSRRLLPGEDPNTEPPVLASDPSVPEFLQPSTPCNPFLVDIYTIGNLIRMDFMDVGHS